MRVLAGGLMVFIAVLAVVGFTQTTSGVTPRGWLTDGNVMQSIVQTV